MKTIYKIAKTELQTLFYSPVAWLVIVIFTFQAAMTFMSIFGGLVRNQALGYELVSVTSNVFSNPWGGVFPAIQGYLFLYIPLLTMGLMSREFGSGSIRLLYSSPVTNVQIILGKFLSMMIYGLVLIGIMLIFTLFGIFTIKDFDLPLVLTGLLGIYLLVCAYAAVGLFMSSLTSYQVVAAMLTLAMLGALNYVKDMWQDIEFIRDITYWLSISGRAGEFVIGLICSEDLFYFIIVIVLFLILAIIRLQACRQKSPWFLTLGRYVGVILLACFLGYLSSRPKLMGYYDVTATKMNTLTPNSQDVISRLEGGLTITSYLNVLDEQDIWTASPSRVKTDQVRFKQYVRFKPDIKLKYVYYYDTIQSLSQDQRFPEMNTEQRAKEIMRIHGLDSNIFLRPEQIREQIDLSGEKNMFVRLLERENGEKTFLRVFDDMLHHPGEAEITAAFKRIAMELPTVGFLIGHGERDINRTGDREYSGFALEKKFRYALINQGFDVLNVSLTDEIPDNIKILVIAEMKEPLTETEEINLEHYIARGGNLFITCEPKRSEVMNILLEKFGVRLVAGTLVQLTENFSPDLIVAKPSQEATKLNYYFDEMKQNNRSLVMSGAAGLEYDGKSGYNVIPLFMCDSLAWNEVETTNFVDERPVLSVSMGEIQKPYATVLALSREINNKEQKIMILGDADCISNGELSMHRRGISASNYTIIMGGFYWMSDNEVPIDVRRPTPPDNVIYLNEAEIGTWQVLMTWILPGILLMISIFIWIRRRGR